MAVWMWLIASLLGLIFTYGHWVNGYFERRGTSHAKPPFPFVGNLSPVIFGYEHTVFLFDKYYKEFKNDSFFGTFLFHKPSIFIKDLNLIRDIGIKDFEYFKNHRSLGDEDLNPLFGNFLISLKDKKWKDMRISLSPIFTGSKLRKMFELVQECGEQLNEYFTQNIDELSKKDLNTIDIDLADVATKFANDVISTVAFGIKSNNMINPDNELMKNGIEVSEFDYKKLIKIAGNVVIPYFMKFLSIKIYNEELSNYFNKLVHGSLDYREKHHISRADVLDHLSIVRKETIKVEDPTKEGESIRKWSDDDITAQAVLFFVGGSHIPALTLSVMLFELAANQDMQKRLQKEIDEVLLSKEGLNYNTLMDMKYLDMVLSETLRKWPPNNIIDRECFKDYTIPAQYTKNNKPFKVEKGMGIFISLFSIHRDPKYFPNPEVFDPERFSESNKANFEPLAYLPFGIGPRRCIGSRYALMMIKVAIFSVLSSFEVIQTKKTKYPFEISKRTFFFKCEAGMWVGLKKRK